MFVYLIRHADAVDLVPDHARPLSDRGREQMRMFAGFLRRSAEFTPEEIWHSSLRRARETAQLLNAESGRAWALREVAGLTPDDAPNAIAGALASSNRSVALVGHEPHLSSLASLLVTGASTPTVFAMNKGATLALERAGRCWVVRWHIYPELLA